MFKTYRMPGQEREADLERDAQAAARARQCTAQPLPPEPKDRRTRMNRLVPRLLRSRWAATLATVAVVLAGGAVAFAAHVTPVDPATVPTGFLAAHNAIADVPVGPFARAVKPGGGEFSVQHVRLGANEATGWHTHPGPAVVTVARGTLTYEDACRRATYGPGEGFVDRGFGHTHRAIAGPEGVDFYVTYVLPPGSATHVLPAQQPSSCRSGGGGFGFDDDERPPSEPPAVVLTFEKRAVSDNSYVGTLEGGGTVDMLVLDRSSTTTMQRFRVLLRVDRDERWLAALVRGTFEYATGKTTLAGRVSYGNWLRGAKLSERGELVSESPLTFRGTIALTPRGFGHDDD